MAGDAGGLVRDEQSQYLQDRNEEVAMSDHEPQQNANAHRSKAEELAASQIAGGTAMIGETSIYDTPLWDASLSVETRVDWLLRAMTIEEKLGFLATTTLDLPRLGIKRFSIGSEAAHGIEARHDQGDHPTAPDITTSLPQPIGMVATWDADLLERAGEAVGVEARALYHRRPEIGLFRWAPTVDLERDPRWGRNEEGYGEDPVLTGDMAGAYVRGMQGGGPEATRDHLRISAALKHFFANNVEDGRCVTNSTIDARNRHEYYYEPFRRCIEQSGVTSVMTAYNAVNGTVQMHDLRVKELLHGEYGLNGHVVSDGGAVSLVHDARHDTDSHAETVARSIKAGVDCMTDDMNMVHTAVCNAWERGLLDEADVDRALRRSFTTKVRLGLFDRPAATDGCGCGDDGTNDADGASVGNDTGHCDGTVATTNPFDAVSDADIDSPEHRAIALRVAEESVVLLKNDGLLPFTVERAADEGRTEGKISPLATLGRNDIVKDSLGRNGTRKVAVSRDGSGTVVGRNDSECVFGRSNDKTPDAGRGEVEHDVAVIGPLGDQWFQDWYGGEPPFRSTVLDGVKHTLSADVAIAADDALDVVLLRFDGRYAALDAAGVLCAADDRESAERFRFQDWGDGSLTFRAESNGLYLTAEDDGTIRANKRIPFGWFVKEVFHLADDGRLTTWSDVSLQLDDNGRIHAVQETDLSAQRIGVPQTVAIGGQGMEDSSTSLRSARNDSGGDAGFARNDDGVDAGVAQHGSGAKVGLTRNDSIRPFAMDVIEHGLERAAALAGKSRMVIAAVGCCSVINGKEDADRPSTAFPPAQRALMQTLVQANQRTAMVLISNYPYDIDWEQEHVPAIVLSAAGGQSMGDAIARVLFGLTAPAGRLPQTWYGERVALPDKNDYDIISTKRTYQWHDGDVLYPFGHGLTYAPFEYGDLRVTAISGDVDAADVHGETAAVHASVCIANVGTVASDEVVQIYVRHPDEGVTGAPNRAGVSGVDSPSVTLRVPAPSAEGAEIAGVVGADAVPMPRRRLVAFRREHGVRPGERRTIEFDIPREELRVFDVRKGDFRVPDGEYTLEVGASSADIRVTATVRVCGEPPVARPRNRWIPVDHWDESGNADLIAADPLPGQRKSEACAMVPHDAPQAKRARGEITPDELEDILAQTETNTSERKPPTVDRKADAKTAGPIAAADSDHADCGDAPSPVTEADSAQTAAWARFAGFEPFEPNTRLHLAGTGLAQVRVRAGKSVIAPDADGSFPLPVDARALTLIVPVGSVVSGLLVE